MAISYVFLRCRLTGTYHKLPNGWLVRTAAQAAPLPIFALLLLAPLDSDLIEVLLKDRIVVALAGLYGVVETLKDIRHIGRNSRKDRGGFT